MVRDWSQDAASPFHVGYKHTIIDGSPPSELLMIKLQNNLTQKGWDQVSQDPVQATFEYSQGWKSHHLSGFLFQCVLVLHWLKKAVRQNPISDEEHWNNEQVDQTAEIEVPKADLDWWTWNHNRAFDCPHAGNVFPRITGNLIAHTWGLPWKESLWEAESGLQAQESLSHNLQVGGQCRMANSRSDRPRGLKCHHFQDTQLLPARRANYKIPGSTWALLSCLWWGRQLEPALVMNYIQLLDTH